MSSRICFVLHSRAIVSFNLSMVLGMSHTLLFSDEETDTTKPIIKPKMPNSPVSAFPCHVLPSWLVSSSCLAFSPLQVKVVLKE